MTTLGLCLYGARSLPLQNHVNLFYMDLKCWISVGSQEDTETGFCTGFDSPGISTGLREMQGSKQIWVVPSKFGLGEIQTRKSFILCGDASEHSPCPARWDTQNSAPLPGELVWSKARI